MKSWKFKLCPNCQAEITEDLILTLRIDLKETPQHTIQNGHPAACSTRGMRQLWLPEDGNLEPSDWRAQINVFEMKRKQ